MSGREERGAVDPAACSEHDCKRTAAHLLPPLLPYARLISEALRLTVGPPAAGSLAQPPGVRAEVGALPAGAAAAAAAASRSNSSARSLLLRPVGNKPLSLMAASRGDTMEALPLREGGPAAVGAAEAAPALGAPAPRPPLPLAAAALPLLDAASSLRTGRWWGDASGA